MRLTNYLLAIAAIASATFAANAEQISIDAAMRTAQRHLVNKSLKSNRSAESLNLVYAAPNIYNEDENAYYVFNRQNGGFVIVGADDCATSILATIDEGSFDPDNIPDNAKWWLDKSQEQISEAIMNGAEAEVSDRVLAAAQTSTARQSIQPLVTTKWHQVAPYNALCTTTSGERALAGCVAVALAQIVNYHQWPKATLNGDYNMGFWKFSFNDVTFDWDNMASTISSSSPQEQIDAVSSLIYNCGIMVGSNYATDVTTADEKYILRVLKKCFDYSNSLSFRSREYYRTCDWEDIIINELANNRPVLYTGGGADRHAFVCDGYNAEDNTFHMNWGWSGAFNGYYSLDAIKIYDRNGSQLFNFNGGEDIIINIMPSNVGDNKQDTPVYCQGNAVGCYYVSNVNYFYITADSYFTTVADYCYGSSTSNYDTYVNVGLKFIDVETNEEYMVSKSSSKINATGDGSRNKRYGKLNVDNILKNGKSYDVIPYYKEPDAEDWKPVIFKYNATKVWRVTRAADGTYSAESAMTPAKLNITSMTTYNAVTGADFTVDAEVENEGDANYLGTLKIALVDDKGNTAMSMSKNIDVPGKTTQTVTLAGSLLDVSKGSYSLVASDSSSNQVSDGYTVTVSSNVFTGIEDVEASKFAISISDSEISIKASAEVNTVEVYNIAGQKVYGENINGNTATISIANFAQGVYVVKVIAQGEVAVKQFVKK